MLVLSRREDESIIINDNIEIKIIDLRSDQVKIGIIAPRDVKVYRREVYEEIQQENASAARATIATSSVDALRNMMSSKKDSSK